MEPLYWTMQATRKWKAFFCPIKVHAIICLQLTNGILLQVGHLTIHSVDGHHTNFDLRRL